MSTWQNCSWPTAIALVFRGFGLAESARDPVWDPRLERLLAFAKSAEVWVKLSGIGRVPDDWAQAAVGRMLDELGPEQLLWGSEWPHVMVAHAYAPSYAESLKWLGEVIPTSRPDGRSLARRLLPSTASATKTLCTRGNKRVCNGARTIHLVAAADSARVEATSAE
ncbi:amidohydrolase family protein [Bradyrhizobium sp. 200]|nr:amidohydrolase family protein [Bradyrhizobium sp. 200]